MFLPRMVLLLTDMNAHAQTAPELDLHASDVLELDVRDL